ncbi:MAG: hypothetical protein DRO11_05790 [Methanobacteriota archaeon]|nr:MAG: hypothetical protein DRO11_05790 [Euryarchaeota archaeon]
MFGLDVLFHLFFPLALAELLCQDLGVPEVFILCFSGLLPDLDVFPALVSNPGFHRGPTHSPTFVLLTSFCFTVSLVLLGFRDFKRIFLLSFFGVCSHIVFDGITTRGIPVFWPLNREKYSLPLFLAVDPYILMFSLAYLVARVLFWLRGFKMWAINLFFVVFFLCYLLVRVFGYSKALSLANKRGLSQVFPTPNPLRWLPA